MTTGHLAGDAAAVEPVEVDPFRRRLRAAGRPAIVALVLGTLVLLASGLALAALVVQPHDGVSVSSARGVFEDGGYRVRDVDRGALRPGDLVVAVGGRTWTDMVDYPLEGTAIDDGDTVAVGVLRDGMRRTLSVVAERRDLGEVAGSDWSGAVLVPVLALMGSFLFWRRPDLAAARVFFVVGGLALLSWVLITHGPSPFDLAAGRWWYLLGGASLLAVETALAHFVVVLPLGPEERSPRWIPLVYLVPLAVHALDSTVSAAGSDPGPVLGAWAFPRIEPLVVTFTLVAAVWRYRRSTERLARRQLRLIAGQLVIAGAVYLVVFAVPEALGGDTLLPVALSAAPFLSFPVVIAIAVLRFDLFELRLLLHRSLLYASLAVVLAGCYLALAGGLAALLGHRAGLVPSAVVAAIVALAVHPLRRRFQRLADRLVYGTTAEPAEVLAALGRRLEDRGQPGAVLAAVVDTVAGSLGRPYVAIEIDGEHGSEVVAAHGAVADHRAEAPLLHQGVDVGRLVIGLRDPSDDLGSVERRLVDGLAAHIGTAVTAVRRDEDLRRSRERLVTAVEEERRRLGRDLHDGLGPALAASIMKLEAAERMAGADVGRAMELQEEVRRDLAALLADVRRIAYALRPAALDQLGLVGALQELANRVAGQAAGHPDVAVTVTGDLGGLPAAVEVAAYRIVSEAVTNAVRHSGAGRCDVRVAVAAGRLAIEVTDDGAGLPDHVRNGVGLPSMVERAAELGGELVVRRGPSAGTMVAATLPLGDR